MREGFTTGSCAAAAALASCLWRRDGECPARVQIVVPEGRSFAPDILAREDFTCGIVKDAGDDPDITNDCEVRARVDIGESDGGISFRAGEGVGILTEPGLKLRVGEAAINPVPREMIAHAVRSVYGAREAVVTVSVAGGAELAKKTFNPRLGVVGGISILGTSGIVRPMSEEALTESVALELSMRRAQGAERLALVFGNQGEAAVRRLYPALPAVQMSNFVGFALDEAAKLGFSRLLVAGHPGKLSKLSAGVMQTHSRYADARREPMIARLALMGADADVLRRVYDCLTTEAAVGVIAESGLGGVWNHMADAAQDYCEARLRGAVEVDILFLDGDGLPLGRSERMRRNENRWPKG